MYGIRITLIAVWWLRLTVGEECSDEGSDEDRGWMIDAERLEGFCNRWTEWLTN